MGFLTWNIAAKRQNAQIVHDERILVQKRACIVTSLFGYRFDLISRELQSGPVPCPGPAGTGTGTEILFFTGTGPGLNLPSGPVNFLSSARLYIFLPVIFL
jgi:hypothetical protein